MGLLKFSFQGNVNSTFLVIYLGPLIVAALVLVGAAQDIAGGPGDATDDYNLLDTKVQNALREELQKDNCIRELEVCVTGLPFLTFVYP